MSTPIDIYWEVIKVLDEVRCEWKFTVEVSKDISVLTIRARRSGANLRYDFTIHELMQSRIGVRRLVTRMLVEP